MKKVVFIILTFIFLVSSISAFADNQGTIGIIDDRIEVTANVGPYAAVVPQKLKYDVTWEWWFYRDWYEVEPGMDFGHFTGEPDQPSRIQDSNCFLVETNCPVDITFDGTPLTHVDGSTTLPTTYWAWQSLGVEDVPLRTVVGNIFHPAPFQIIPALEIGYFGDSSDIPDGWKFDINPEWLDKILDLAVNEIWPSAGEVRSTQIYDGICEKGLYAFQVFGFTGMRENISDVKAGDYLGEIRLTVAAAN